MCVRGDTDTQKIMELLVLNESLKTKTGLERGASSSRDKFDEFRSYKCRRRSAFETTFASNQNRRSGALRTLASQIDSNEDAKNASVYTCIYTEE